jgi:hypothetical protein
MENLRKHGIRFISQVNSLIKPEPIFTFTPFPNG